jgi:hypothetical protein
MDSNTITQGPWHLESAGWAVLLHLTRSGAVALVVPEVVVREVVGRFTTEVAKWRNQLAEARRRLARLMGEPPLIEAWPAEEVLGANYESLLRERLINAGALIAPIPGVQLSELVDRAIRRLVPFNEKGNGFRDALIWESVVDSAWSAAQVVLISNDSSAFAESSRSAELHGDLKAELEQRGCRGTVLLVASVVGFLDLLGVGDPNIAAQLVGEAEAQHDHLCDMVMGLLVDQDLDSPGMPYARGHISGVSTLSTRVGSVSGVRANQDLILSHLVIQAQVQIEVYVDAATPQVRSVEAVLKLSATAAYHVESRNFSDPAIDLPTLEQIPEVRLVIGRGLATTLADMRLQEAGRLIPPGLAEQLAQAQADQMEAESSLRIDQAAEADADARSDETAAADDGGPIPGEDEKGNPDG